MAQTLFEKLWQEHLVEKQSDGTDLIYIDRVFLHERTGSIALSSLRADGRKIFCPEQVFCCMDHIVDTYPDRSDETTMPSGRDFIVATREGAHEAGLTLFDLDDPRQGIVHVVSRNRALSSRVSPWCVQTVTLARRELLARLPGALAPVRQSMPW